MKKILLLVAVLTATSLMTFGQTNKVWNVGNDPVLFPVSSGYATGNNPTIDGLTITPGGTTVTNMAVVEANAKTFTSPTTSVAYTFINRFKYNGAGYSGAAAADAVPTVNMPTQRYLSFQVAGNSTIYVIGASGSTGSSRNLFLTDGATLIGTVNFPDSPLNEGTFTYTGPATTLYLFTNAAINMYYISATNVLLSGINTPNASKRIVEIQNYDILGKQVSKNAKGMIVQKVTYDDGTTSTLKSFVKSEK
jgi:hypothetical protein